MALECSFDALANVDQTDPDALQALLQACNGVLWDPQLWAWAIGITVVCAAVGAIIGVAKGRWLAGLIWGAALGPIGWVVIALSKANLPQCPECGRSNTTNARSCRHCGVNLQVAASRPIRSRMKDDSEHQGR
jgi:hypothetical protein